MFSLFFLFAVLIKKICYVWCSGNVDENVGIEDSLTLLALNLRFHTDAVFMLFMFDEVFTFTPIARDVL